jgi:type VI secretion system protein ImpA
LKRVVLLRHSRLGAFTGGDFDRFRAGAESEDGYGMFRALLNETPEEDLLAIAARLEGIGAAIKRADLILDANAEGDTSVNFRATYETLDDIRRSVLSFTATASEDAQGGGDGPSDAGGGSEAAGGGGGPRIAGRVESRDDVIKALDAIADYYRRKEPISPVPLALARARGWVDADFMSVMADIAPDSLSELKRVLHTRPKDEY